MKFCLLDTIDPHYNLAVEEYLFNTCEEEVFLLWQNSKTVVIGKNQNAYAEIDREVLDKNEIKLARRITGGGAVYHDEGNINYSFILPNAKTKGIDFEYFSKPVIKALENLGVNVTLSGRNDLVLANGKKVSGNAQHRVQDRVLHHGTLLFSSDLSALEKVLKVSDEKLISKAVKSVRARVQNLSDYISLSVDDFIAYLSAFILNEYKAEIFEVESCAEIDALYNRNKSIGWLYPENSMLSDYSIVKKRRFPFGLVEVSLSLKNDVVKAVKISGDFFEINSVSELEQLIENTSLSNLKTTFSKVDVSSYISGITNEEFISLLNS
ncbi:MAG: lipoate--protein ligase [Clostridia bacterium]|nr:lipoate--protein ligase [Clostridia bacterium]